MVIFQYNLYIFGIHLRTVLYPKPCYNEPCYNEVEVYLHIKGMKTKEIHDDMVKTLCEDGSPSYSTEREWLTDFKLGNESTDEAPVRSSNIYHHRPSDSGDSPHDDE